jgi:oleate hydratase
MMPFITSQFMPRVKGDRPTVRPTGTTNIAFIGQYCEIPDDVVFTVEYSVRSAQTAVYSLLNLDKEVTPLYKGQHDIEVLFSSLKTMFH